MTLTRIHVSVHEPFFYNTFVNWNTNCNKVGFNIRQLIWFGFHMCNPPGSYAHSLCIQTPSIKLYKLDTFFNKPNNICLTM